MRDQVSLWQIWLTSLGVSSQPFDYFWVPFLWNVNIGFILVIILFGLSIDIKKKMVEIRLSKNYTSAQHSKPTKDMHKHLRLKV